MRSLRCGVAAALMFSSLALAGDRIDPKVELGRRLFMDPTVSRGGEFSCAACHDPERGFSDARQFSEDENGKTRRHSQSVLDLGDRPLHWDGEFATVRDLLTARLGTTAQALDVARETRTRNFEISQGAGREPNQQEFQRTIQSLTPPYYGPVTQTRRVPVPLTLRLEEDDRYVALFRAAFGSSKITNDRIIDAMHAYLLSLKTGENAYDRFAAGNPGALSPAARRGLALFTGKADCASCHEIGKDARFTDDAFHNTGVTFRNLALGFGGAIGTDGGAGEMSFVAADLGKFKTPSLRDVARRAPYMHDGSFRTLEDVVGYYNKGGTANGRLDQHVRPLGLSEPEVRDLVAFLEALTSDERPGIGPLPLWRRHAWIKVQDLRGHALKGVAVEVAPAGDRLEGGREEPPQILVTDAEGVLSFDFPKWTHVTLRSAGYEVEYGWMIPDCVKRMTVLAAPKDQVAVKVRMPDGADAPQTFLASDAEKKGRAGFERVRTLPDKSVLYVAGAHGGTAVASIGGREFEIDLTGGWAEPLDLRPEPQ